MCKEEQHTSTQHASTLPCASAAFGIGCICQRASEAMLLHQSPPQNSLSAQAHIMSDVRTRRTRSEIVGRGFE